MKAIFTPEVSRNTELTLKMTATLEEWEALVKTVDDARHDSRSMLFSRVIKRAIEEVDKHFETEQSLEE